jgi:succinyl-CoA synthetase alpha subunit
MGHAGAIISGGKGTAAEKMATMKKCGIHVVDSPAVIGEMVARVLAKGKKKPAPKKKVMAKPKKKVAKKKKK